MQSLDESLKGLSADLPAANPAKQGTLKRKPHRLSYSIAWLMVVDKRTPQDISEETGLSLNELKRIVGNPYFKRYVRELLEAVGTVREAALKRYSFELETLVDTALSRIRGILESPTEKSDTVLKAAVAVLDRAGVSAARKVEGTLKLELPESSLKRIEEAVRELPMLETDDSKWEYAHQKPKIRVVDDDLGTSEPKDEPV